MLGSVNEEEKERAIKATKKRRDMLFTRADREMKRKNMIIEKGKEYKKCEH